MEGEGLWASHLEGLGIEIVAILPSRYLITPLGLTGGQFGKRS